MLASGVNTILNLNEQTGILALTSQIQKVNDQLDKKRKPSEKEDR